MERLVGEFLADLTTPPVLVFPDWDTVADGTRPFHVYLRCLHRRIRSRSRTEADERLYRTHRGDQPSYARLRKALDSFRFGGWQHRPGSQTSPRLPLGHQVPNMLRPQGSGKHKQSGKLQRPSPEMARGPHRIRLHSRIPEGKRKRQR